jgi:hypothetical protein
MTLAAPPRLDEDWIVCLGETREVRDGWVACPRDGDELVSVERCVECHLLTWHHDERDARSPCATADDDTW